MKVSTILLLAGVASFVAYFLLSGAIPFLLGLQDALGLSYTGGSMHAARRAITAGHREATTAYFGQGYLRMMFFGVQPVAVLLIAMHHKLAKGAYGSRVWMLLFITVVMQLASGQRWPALTVAIILSVGLLAFEARTRPNIYRNLWSYVDFRLVGLCIALVGIYLGISQLQQLSGRGTDIPMLHSAIRRLSLVPTGRLYIAFPDEYPFRLGMTWVNDIRGLLPGLTKAFAYEVHEIVTGSAHGFTMAPTIFGSMYVNFGPIGVASCSLMLGLVGQYVGLRLLSGRQLRYVAIFGLYSASFALAAMSDIAPIATRFIMIVLFWLSFKIGDRIFEASDDRSMLPPGSIKAQ